MASEWPWIPVSDALPRDYDVVVGGWGICGKDAPDFQVVTYDRHAGWRDATGYHPENHPIEAPDVWCLLPHSLHNAINKETNGDKLESAECEICGIADIGGGGNPHMRDCPNGTP